MKKNLIVVSLFLMSVFSFADTEGISFWLHYDLTSPILKLDNAEYDGEHSWGTSLEYYIPYSENIKYGFGLKWQSDYKLNSSSDFSVHDKPYTYDFLPVYFMGDYFLTEYIYLILHLGLGAVYSDDSFDEEFSKLKNTGFYTGIGIGFEYIEFIYSIDFLEFKNGDDLSVSRLSVRI